MNENLLKAYRGDDKYIFASYAHKDGAEVRSAIKALAAKGYRVWYDEGIEAGSDWAEKIGTSLEKASLMLLFASKNSIKSENVLRELAFAKEHGIPVLTTFLGNVNLSKELERDLLVDQAANLASFKTYGDYVDSIAPALNKYGTGGEALAADYADEKIVFADKQKGKKKATVAIVVVAAIAALAAIGYTAFFKDVPNVVGLTTEEAEQQMAASDFSYNVSLNYSDEYEYGVIFDQSAEGKTLKFVPVVITQSLGPEENLTDVPDTVGKHVSDGAALLLKAGMTKFTIAPEISEQEPAYVFAQSIPAGLRVSKANNITMNVATDGGDIIFEIDGKTYMISGTDVTVFDTEDEEAMAELEASEYAADIAYMKNKYGTTIFDEADRPATWGDMMRTMMEVYGMSRSYVYGQSEGGWPGEDPNFLIGSYDSDDSDVFQGMVVYSAIKAFDKSITAMSNWDKLSEEEMNGGLYPGMLLALKYAYGNGLIPDERAFKFISVGEMASIFANIDRHFTE